MGYNRYLTGPKHVLLYMRLPQGGTEECFSQNKGAVIKCAKKGYKKQEFKHKGVECPWTVGKEAPSGRSEETPSNIPNSEFSEIQLIGD